MMNSMFPTAPRLRIPELMDQPDLDEREHALALTWLARINAVSRTAAALWPPLERLARARPPAAGPLRVLDLAAGGGDTAVSLASRAARSGLAIEVEGCDLSARAVSIAEGRAAVRGARVRFFRLDALTDPIPEGHDVLTCSLFLHHLDDDDAVLLLGRMAAAANHLVLVDDLARSRTGSGLAWLVCRALARSRVVQYDGPASAAAAFTPAEALDLARRAGLEGATVRRHWPSRYLLSWSRP
jgi:2-polyprenyl-3-methyl-5-hydroxy-6-metoxy-1,4-benzoquinol methylase